MAFRGKMGLVIIDGAADLPIADLGGMTPLAAADTPAMDELARRGLTATVCCIPEAMEPGSDVAIMALVGYDPTRDHTGRAPIEAAARGVPVGDGEWVFRCNLVALDGELMKDHSAGGICNASAGRLIDLAAREFRGLPVRFYPGVSYRNLMVYRGDASAIHTTPPHDILDRPFAEYLPTGPGSELLRGMIESSRRAFAAIDSDGASALWFWGEGRPARLEAFERRFGVRGSLIGAVDLVRGLGNLIGWRFIPVEGATGNIDTNYAGKGRAAVDAVDGSDLVCVHVEAPDEAGHQGDWREKRRSLEEVDRHIVAPLLRRLERCDQWRLMVMPDHPTPCAVRTHTREPVPLVLAGSDVKPDAGRLYSEAEAAACGERLAAGAEIMRLLTG